MFVLALVIELWLIRGELDLLLCFRFKCEAKVERTQICFKQLI